MLEPAASHAETITHWLALDAPRMEALAIAADMGLPDWCLAAGFVRNLVWDRLHGFDHATPLNDLDLVYFDPEDASEARDLDIEHALRQCRDLPWSVRNQARMHLRNGDRPYASTADAMSYWVEVETAVGARWSQTGAIALVAPFGLDALMAGTVTINAKRPKPADFRRRVASKRWLELWPQLIVDA